MAANLGQAFLGGAGMVPTIAQELAAGNFADSRESFHDYIYSKLILGEDKANNPGISASNPPVFPNSNLANSYPNPGTTASSPYTHLTANSMPSAGNHLATSKAFSSPALPKTPLALTPKPSSSKKKSNPAQQQQQSSLPVVSPDGGLTKVKKKSHHKKKEKTNVCDVCGRGFAEKYTLNRHMLTHTHIKPYSCTKCNMAFSRSDGLAKHMAAGHRRIDAHHCDVCGGTFNSEVSFEQHRREYGNTLPFVCNLCMLAFSQCCHLNYHMKSHSLNKLNDSVGSDNQEDKHDAIDVSELIPDDFSPIKKDTNRDSAGMFMYPPGSSKLGKSMGDHSLGLLDPNIVIKPEIEDLPTCSAINNQISSSGNTHAPGSGNQTFDVLSSLSSVSSSSGPLSLANRPANQLSNNLTPGNVPATPGASYLPDTASNLNSSSTNEPPTISDMDMKKYFDIKVPNPKLLEGLDLQQPGAGEDGLFRCGLCGKGFTRKYHMQRHVKLHTRGPLPRAHLLDWTRRPYACGVCKMGFTRQHHLTRHMLIHTGERPHSCHVCGKAFRRYTNLSLHVRTVHGAERPFKCHICGRGFPRLYSLQRHHKLHAKHAAGIGSMVSDPLYKGFKAVGTVVDHLDDNKPPTYSSANHSSHRHSPTHSRESISSEHSDGSERYEHDSSPHRESTGNAESARNASPMEESDMYRHGHGGASETVGPHVQGNEHQASMSRHEDRLSGQIPQPSAPPTQNPDFIAQHSRLSNQSNQDMRKQNPGQSRNSNNLISSVHQSGEPGHGQNTNPGQAHNVADFTSQQPMQHNSDRYHPPTSIPSQTMPSMDSPVAGNFNQLDLREASNFALAQRGNGTDSFTLAQQRIQSPHSMLNTIERPGSRGMMNPPGLPDKYISTSASYIQQPPSLQSQQRASMDLSAVRNTMSPAGLAEQVNFAHSRHVEMSVNRGGVGDHPAFPHNHNVSGLQFPGGSHSLYQQQANDNISHMELHHPNPSASPMPVHSHNNNLQY